LCRYLYKDWYANYESLTNFILPRSSKLLKEDTEYGLFTVTLFKRVVEDFKNVAREKRFTVREFKLDEVCPPAK
jgi:V-type H+-transporting ATPase subunit C